MADGNGLELDSNGVGGKMLLNGREVSIEGFFPYKGDFGRSTLVVSADGVCDPLMQNVRERLAYTRHALFVLRGTVANLGDPIVFAPQSIVVGNAGPENDAGPLGYGPLSGPLTRAETNAQKDGGLVQQGQSFVTVGMSVAAGAPWFVTPGEGSTAANCSLLDNRHFPKWLRDPGTGYASAAIQALNETTVLEKWKIGPTTACEYDLMPLSMQNASRYSETQATGIPGYFWNFAVPAVTGGRQSGRELNFGINNLRRGGSVPGVAGRLSDLRHRHGRRVARRHRGDGPGTGPGTGGGDARRQGRGRLPLNRTGARITEGA